MTSVPPDRASPGQRILLRAVAGFAASMAIAASSANGAVVTDASGDVLPSFRDDECPGCGFHDLDVTQVSATYDSHSLRLNATLAGNVGETPEGLYVWGIDRGSGTEFLHDLWVKDPEHNPEIGQGVFFDAFVVIHQDATARLFFLTPEATLDHFVDLDPGSATIHANTISLNVDRSLLPSAGSDFASYGYNFWPRYDDITKNEQVADFAPDGSIFTADAVPEPASWALMIAGFGLGGIALRRRRVLQAA